MPHPISPEREAEMAEAMALAKAGHSLRSAAEATGLPYSTVQYNYQRLLGPDAPGREEERKRADERILASAYCAAEQLLQRMSGEVGQADHKTVTAWSEVSTRIIGRMRGWDAKSSGGTDSSPRWANTLERILEGGGATVTVTVQRPEGDE